MRVSSKIRDRSGRGQHACSATTSSSTQLGATYGQVRPGRQEIVHRADGNADGSLPGVHETLRALRGFPGQAHVEQLRTQLGSFGIDNPSRCQPDEPTLERRSGSWALRLNLPWLSEPGKVSRRRCYDRRQEDRPDGGVAPQRQGFCLPPWLDEGLGRSVSAMDGGAILIKSWGRGSPKQSKPAGPCGFKLGIDPTGSDIHPRHSILFRKVAGVPGRRPHPPF